MAAVRAAVAFAALLLIAARPLPAPVAASAAAPVPSVRAGVEKWKANDYPGAVAIWMPFAAAGDPDALFNMGQAYKLGRGVTQDAATARDYYRKAALKGHLPAQANLGIALFQVGEKPEAIKWLRTAADRGEARAQYVLGIAAYNGDGLPRSQSVGYGYLLRAQASGLPQATVALGSIAPALSPTDRNAGEAVAASLASGKGVPTALAAATAPKLILPPGGGVLKPLPPTTAPPVQVAVAVPVIKPAVAATKPATVPTPPLNPAPAPRQVATVTPAVSKPALVAPVTAPPVVVASATPVPPPATTVRPPTAAPMQGPVLDGGARPATSPPVTVATTEVPASKSLPAPAPVVAAASAPAEIAPIPKAAAKVVVAPKPVVTAALKPFETIIPDRPVLKKPGWRVQLGAFSARKQADTAWASAKPDAGTAKPIFNTDGPVVKLQIGPFATRDAAKAACAKLSDAGRSCFVTEG